jgi:hypothetical protein
VSSKDRKKSDDNKEATATVTGRTKKARERERLGRDERGGLATGYHDSK